MRQTQTIFLILIIITPGWGQIYEARNSILNQLIDEIKTQAKNYKEVTISGPILWDTSEYVFKNYFTKYDTNDQTGLELKNKSARRRIISFSKIVTSKDYQAFREQVIKQRSDSFSISTKIKGINKVTDKMDVSFSQPLVTIDGKIVVVKILEKYSSGGYRKATTVYMRTQNKWSIWDHLENQSLSY